MAYPLNHLFIPAPQPFLHGGISQQLSRTDDSCCSTQCWGCSTQCFEFAGYPSSSAGLAAGAFSERHLLSTPMHCVNLWDAGNNVCDPCYYHQKTFPASFPANAGCTDSYLPELELYAGEDRFRYLETHSVSLQLAVRVGREPQFPVHHGKVRNSSDCNLQTIKN